MIGYLREEKSRLAQREQELRVREQRLLDFTTAESKKATVDHQAWALQTYKVAKEVNSQMQKQLGTLQGQLAQQSKQLAQQSKQLEQQQMQIQEYHRVEEEAKAEKRKYHELVNRLREKELLLEEKHKLYEEYVRAKLEKEQDLDMRHMLQACLSMASPVSAKVHHSSHLPTPNYTYSLSQDDDPPDLHTRPPIQDIHPHTPSRFDQLLQQAEQLIATTNNDERPTHHRLSDSDIRQRSPTGSRRRRHHHHTHHSHHKHSSSRDRERPRSHHKQRSHKHRKPHYYSSSDSESVVVADATESDPWPASHHNQPKQPQPTTPQPQPATTDQTAPPTALLPFPVIPGLPPLTEEQQQQFQQLLQTVPPFPLPTTLPNFTVVPPTPTAQPQPATVSAPLNPAAPLAIPPDLLATLAANCPVPLPAA
eukprot:TRINITY_DN5968_c0_g2_i1.p1 TRINITY_DN5968_c0_g2~~TRINITY_DN5968_c0_g2_i1.p1  ORF type:complete len:422 (-),score=53.90 TRINITY_DN5968_c0_g2_i1:350-1615(-)